MRIWLAFLLLVSTPAFAQSSHRHHPSADMPLHEKFYSTWYMPDQPTRSCCNKADCYGKWLRIPTAKVERRRDNPDGRNHLCAPPPTTTPDTVFCFALGGGI